MSQSHKVIYFTQPFNEFHSVVYSALLEAATGLNVVVVRSEHGPIIDGGLQSINQVISEANIVVADIS